MAAKAHICDSCGAEALGYSRAELEGEGWQWHRIDTAKLEQRVAIGRVQPYFVLCGQCRALYALRRHYREALAA